MSRKNYAIVQKTLELRRAALAANSAELPQMELPRQKVEEVLSGLKDLEVQQASLTAAKQEATKRRKALHDAGLQLLTFVDAGLRQHYGTQSEKLVEFGRQPFRSQPRVRLVGPDGKPLKPSAVSAEPPAPSPAHG